MRMLALVPHLLTLRGPPLSLRSAAEVVDAVDVVVAN